MNTLSIPVGMMASISAYVGFYHGLIYLRRRQYREHLTFALLCFANSLYDVLCVGLYNVATVAEGVKWQRGQFVALALISIAFLWFVADYTRLKSRKVIYPLSVFYLLAFFIQLFDRSNFTFVASQPAIKDITLPFGLEITYHEAAFGPFSTFQGIVGLGLIAYLLWCGIRFYRQGNKREASALMLALVLMAAAAISDTAVGNGLYKFIYTIEYGYMGMILLMAFSLSRTVVEAAEAKESLHQSEERFRSLVETSSDLVWETDQKGVYTYVSPKIHELLGFVPQELVGKTPFDMMLPEEGKRVRELFMQSVAKREPLRAIENTNLHKDGSLVILETNGAPFFDSDGNLCGYRGIDRDITERKLVEAERERLIGELENKNAERERLIDELESKNAELERFTYTVSHDLKSPLVTIRGFLGFVEKNALAGNIEQLKTDIERIQNAAAKMHQLLTELLELSRIGRMMNPAVNVEFETIAYDAVELARGRIEARGVQVDIMLGLPAVHGDRARLVEVVQNLIDNSVKFMGMQPEPRIEIGQQGEMDGKPVLYVKDNGTGIEPRYHERVFGLFDKLDANSDGTGVGLALVKRIVEVHGGKIWVESEGVAGKGAAFYFTLPGRK